MPFGMRNAGNTFQRMMDHILAGLSFVFCYLDDIIIASRDEEERLEHLREVFSQAAPGGRPRPASAAASQRPASSWLIFSSHPLPQGLVLARGPVAEQMYEYSDTENPPNCVGGIREFICAY
jgi:hypothetical protein